MPDRRDRPRRRWRHPDEVEDHKVLHPIAGRSMIGHVLTPSRPWSRPAWSPWSATSASRSARTSRRSSRGSVLAVQESQDGTGHAVRIAMDALGPDQSGTVSSPRATCRCSRARACGPSPRTTPLRPGRERADRRGGGPLRLRPRDPRRRRRGRRRSWSRRTRPRSRRRSPRSTAASSPSTRRSSRTCCRAVATTTPRASTTSPTRAARARGRAAGRRVPDRRRLQTEGVNDRAELAALGREMNRRILARWMAEGVTVVDPATTWIDVDVVLAPDVTLLPGVQLLGATVVGEGAVIGPDSTLKDVEVGAGREGRPHPRRARGHRRRRRRGPVRLPAPRHRLGRRARSAPSSRPRTATSAPAPRSRTSRTSATPRSARAEHRGRRDLRQLRRRHQDRPRSAAREDRRPQQLRRTRDHRRRRHHRAPAA